MKYSKVLKSDIDEIIADRTLFDPLKGASILVTGATGLIGSMLVRSLHAANEKYSLGLRIFAQIRNKRKAVDLFGSLLDSDDISPVQNMDVICSHIVHALSPTASKYFVENPVETIRSMVDSTFEMLEVAKKNHASVVYLSSMEQYGVPYGSDTVMTEDKVGIIDHLNVRSCYPESKRLCECICASYASEYGVDVKIARLAQTFGAGVPRSDNRMPMQFARAVVAGKDIVLHTEGKSVVNFVYITDAITGIITVLNKGVKSEAYNICNDCRAFTVKEIAEQVAQSVAYNRISVQIKTDLVGQGFAPDNTIRIDSKKIMGIGWKPMICLLDGYKRLVEYLKQISNDHQKEDVK